MSLMTITILVQRSLRMETEVYLRSHPELGEMIQDFVMHCLKSQPEDIQKEAVNYFVRESATPHLNKT